MERHELPQRGPGRIPAGNAFLAHLRPTEHFCSGRDNSPNKASFFCKKIHLIDDWGHAPDYPLATPLAVIFVIHVA